MVELVCFTLPYAVFPFDRALQGVAAAGYRAVGFGLPHEGVLVPSELAGAPELRRLREQASGEEIGSPAVQACYDPGNVHFYEGIDPADDIQSIAATVRAVVAKDHRGPRGRLDFPVPGEGDVDFPRIFGTLAQHGFAGPVTVERLDGTGGPVSAETLNERLRTARQYLEWVLAQAGLTVID